MGITFVGSAVGCGEVTYSVDLSGIGLQAGDLLIVSHCVGAAVGANCPPTTEGYTTIAYRTAADTTDVSLNVSRKLMGETPDASVSFTTPASNYRGSVIAYALRGVDQTTPIDVAVPTAYTQNGGMPNPPSVTPVTSGALVVIVGGQGRDTSFAGGQTVPDGYTNHVISYHTYAGATNHGNLAMAQKFWSGSGAEDPPGWTNWSNDGTDSTASATIAIRPAEPTIPNNYLNVFLSQPFSILGDYLNVSSEQLYSISSSLNVSCEQLYSMVMEIWLAQHYGDVPIISKSLIQPFSHAKVLNKSLLQEYAHALQLEVMLEQDLSMPETMEVFSEHRYGIVAEVLQAVSEQLYQINANSTLFADLVQPYALAGEAARLYQFDTRLYINGERIPFHTLEWQATDTEYAWSCDFAVKDLAVAQKCADGATITITSAGDTWQLKCYGGWFLDKRHASEIYRVSGFSRTKDLDLALPLLGDLPGGMASALVADLAAPFGISVDWQMADGYLAAGKITAGDETPREVIRKIVEDAGGIVQSTPEGNLLIVAEEEIPIPDWPHVVPADTIIARLERISTSEQRDEQRGYNRFLVSDQLASGDGFRWDEVSIDGSTKEVRLFVTPLDPARLFVLGHSGGSDVSIEPFGIRSLAVRDEQVEFVAGAGKTTKPIYSLTGYSWQKANLGAVSYAEDGLLTAAVSAYSLLKISYQTKYYRWIVRDRNIEDVQFIFHEVTP